MRRISGNCQCDVTPAPAAACSIVVPHVVVIIVIHARLNSAILLRQTGVLATVHTEAGAEAEGQKEDALGDNEAAKREAVLLPSVH